MAPFEQSRSFALVVPRTRSNWPAEALCLRSRAIELPMRLPGSI